MLVYKTGRKGVVLFIREASEWKGKVGPKKIFDLPLQ
jgi:hypothetical protein